MDLRLLFEHLCKEVGQKWPGDNNVKYTAVSAFLFLRLICPAVMNPKLFNMMPDHPSPTIARNLTLVAKLLQNLVNMTEFGQKEEYMMQCNSYIMGARGRMQEFLRKISSSTGGSTVDYRPGDTRRALASILQTAAKNTPELKKLLAENKEYASNGKKLLAVVEVLGAKV